MIFFPRNTFTYKLCIILRNIHENYKPIKMNFTVDSEIKKKEKKRNEIKFVEI